jgi:hypothetical protein
MESQTPSPALMTATTTEHFVLQTAANGVIAEAAARSTLYVMALSSSLVATGFIAQSATLLLPFSAIVLPPVLVLGLFTVAGSSTRRSNTGNASSASHACASSTETLWAPMRLDISLPRTVAGRRRCRRPRSPEPFSHF